MATSSSTETEATADTAETQPEPTASRVVESSLVPTGLAQLAAWTWRLLLIGFAIVLITTVLYELRVVTVPLFIALLLSTLLAPPVRWMERKGVPAGLGTALMYVGILVLIVASSYSLSDSLSREFRAMGPQVNKSLDQISDWLKTGPLELSDNQISDYLSQARDEITKHTDTLRSGVTRGATAVIDLIVGLFVTLVMAFFITKDGSKLTRPLTDRLPERNRSVVLSAMRRSYRVLSGYLRGVALTGLVDALAIGIGLAILDVPFLLPLVVLTFFGAFFPLVGATVAGILAVLVALVSVGVVKALIVLAIVIGVQQLEGHLLQPVLVGKAVSLHPIVILFSLSAGAVLAGLLGGFLAVPLVAMVVAATREVEIQHRGAQLRPEPPVPELEAS